MDDRIGSGRAGRALHLIAGIARSLVRRELSNVAWRALSDATGEIQFAKDVEGHYIAANQAFCSLVDLPLPVVLAMRDVDHPYPDVAFHAQVVRRNVIEGGQTICLELELLHRGTGIYRTYKATMSPFRVNGLVAGMTCVGHDVTDSVGAARELRDTRAVVGRAEAGMERFLAAADEDVGENVRKALAELRTPVGLVPDTIQAAAYLETAAALLGRLGELARAGASAPPQVEDFTIGDLLEDLTELWSGVAASAECRFVVVPSQERVRSNRALLLQLVGILVQDAIRHSGSGRVLVDVAPGREGTLKLSVENAPARRETPDGSGADPETEMVLFSAKRLAAVLGHDAVAERRAGTGSSFHVMLPLSAMARDPELQPGTAAAPDLVGTTTLAMGGDPLPRMAVRTLVEGWGSVVKEVADILSAEAAIVTGLEPDILVVDRASLADAMQAIAAVRTITGRQVPTIVLSNEAGDELPDGCASLWKPVRAQELAAVLDGLLRERQSDEGRSTQAALSNPERL